MSETKITRRTALAAGTALPFAVVAGSSILPQRASADGHAAPQAAIQNTFGLGEFTVSTLLAGSRTVGDVQTIFGMNVSEDEFAEVSADNFIPADQAQFFFTPTVIRTGSHCSTSMAGRAPACRPGSSTARPAPRDSG